jgi:(p)ppGpp synthase/HD superfamily hydrolase
MDTANQENHLSFISRFELKLSPKDRELLDFAYDLSKYGHRTQFREGGQRYFEHLRDTALILVDELGVTDVELVISALLHDILEDTFILTPYRIELVFGRRAADIVAALTKSKDKQTHESYIENIKRVGPDAVLVKLCDRLHNVRTLGACPSEKQVRKLKETKEFYLPLIEELSKKYQTVGEKMAILMSEAILKIEKEPAFCCSEL